MLTVWASAAGSFSGLRAAESSKILIASRQDVMARGGAPLLLSLRRLKVEFAVPQREKSDSPKKNGVRSRDPAGQEGVGPDKPAASRSPRPRFPPQKMTAL